MSIWLVIPAQAGIQGHQFRRLPLAPRFRGGDDWRTQT